MTAAIHGPNGLFFAERKVKFIAYWTAEEIQIESIFQPSLTLTSYTLKKKKKGEEYNP